MVLLSGADAGCSSTGELGVANKCSSTMSSAERATDEASILWALMSASVGNDGGVEGQRTAPNDNQFIAAGQRSGSAVSGTGVDTQRNRSARGCNPCR